MEEAKSFLTQDENPLARRQVEALGERAISYERVAQICRARTLADLDDNYNNTQRSANAEQYPTPTDSQPQPGWNNPLPSLQPPLHSIKDEAFSAPVSPMSLYPPNHNFTSTRSPNISFANTPIISTTSPTEITSSPLDENLTIECMLNSLFQLIDHLHLTSAENPISREEHLARVLERFRAEAQGRLEAQDMEERRRSTGASSLLPLSLSLPY